MHWFTGTCLNFASAHATESRSSTTVQMLWPGYVSGLHYCCSLLGSLFSVHSFHHTLLPLFLSLTPPFPVLCGSSFIHSWNNMGLTWDPAFSAPSWEFLLLSRKLTTSVFIYTTQILSLISGSNHQPRARQHIYQKGPSQEFIICSLCLTLCSNT